MATLTSPPVPTDRCSSKVNITGSTSSAIQRLDFHLWSTKLEIRGWLCAAGFVLSGEKYNPSSAAYYGVVPEHPFSLAGGGWGAWEIAGRFSTIDLNDQLGTATGIAGGRQTLYTAALN